jgi:chorismate mutase / prephenate dehydrogenase
MDKRGLQKLDRIRKHIDRADLVIVTALAERMSLIGDIGRIKKKHKISISLEKRDERVLKNFLKHAKANGLDKGFAEELFLSVMNEAKRQQQKIIKGR